MGTLTDINPNPVPATGWRQTFHDGFNGAFLDRAAWPIVQFGVGANGAFQYSPANVFGFDGSMWVSNQAAGVSGWTSGAFSQGWNGQLYGRYEIHARMEPGQGTAFAILLWPSDSVLSYEVDIIEPRNGSRTTNSAVFHGPDGNAEVVTFNYDATQWHTYTLDWTPEKLTIWLDGNLLVEHTTFVPDRPMSLGFLGYVARGDEAFFGGGPNESTPANVNLEVDWVRIWTPEDRYPGALPAALYGTSPADLRATSNPYTGVWTAGEILNAAGQREFALTGVRNVGNTNYAATWNAAQWNDQLKLVSSAPASWEAGTATRLLYANFVQAEINLRAAGQTALTVVVEGAQFGNVATADGNDTLTWVAHSDPDAGANNTMLLVTGGGNDTVIVTSPVQSSLDDPFAWGADWHGDYGGQSSRALVNAGAGNDTIILQAGAAVVDGGPGTDTVVFGGPSSQYAVQVLGDGSTQVTDGTGALGTVQLFAVEQLRFSDTTIAAPGQAPNPNPFDIGPVTAPPGSRVRQDLDGDGRADLLWQHDGGPAAVWLMNGVQVTGGAVLGPNPGPGWRARGTGDFDGDGRADLLWQHDGGPAAIWLMNGTQVTGGGVLAPNPGPSWRVVGAGDLGGDGRADILWQHEGGQVAVWMMNGAQVVAGAVLGVNPGADWRAVGVGDLNGDGKADLLWQHAAGPAAAWIMDGTQIVSGGVVGPDPGPSWHARGARDVSGDGRADILWQHDGGQAAVWLMNGLQIAGAAEVGGNPGSGWHLI